MFVNSKVGRIELDHILEVTKTTNFHNLNVLEIKDRVLFVKKFRKCESAFLKNGSGYIIRTNFLKLHN